MTEIQGPLGFTDMDAEGMLIEGFEELGTNATIYNYPYYPVHMEKMGFEKDADWIELSIDVPTEVPERLTRISKIVMEKYGEEAFEQMFAAERDLFENLFRTLPESQRLVVRAIARESVSSFTEDYRARHFLPTLSTVGTAARRLAADSRIDVVDGKYQLLDPLFAHYCREKV